MVAVGALVMMPIQFAMFYATTSPPIPPRSQSWFEYNIRGGMEEIIGRVDRTGAGVHRREHPTGRILLAVYLAKHIRDRGLPRRPRY